MVNLAVGFIAGCAMIVATIEISDFNRSYVMSKIGYCLLIVVLGILNSYYDLISVSEFAMFTVIMFISYVLLCLKDSN